MNVTIVKQKSTATITDQSMIRTMGFTNTANQKYQVQDADGQTSALTLYSGTLDECIKYCHYNSHIILTQEN